MAFLLVSRYVALLLLCLSALRIESVDESSPFSFSFEKFEKGGSFGSRAVLYGDAEVGNSGVLMFGKGRIVRKKPIRFFGINPSPGFSTNFSFSISGGYDESLAFFLVPSKFSKFGVPPKFLDVKFDVDGSGSSVAVAVGGEISARNSNLSDFNLVLNSEQKLHAWIDYNGASKILEVRVSKSRDLRPEKALVSCGIDLSIALWRDAMDVGISSSPSGDSTKTSSIYSWSFEVKHGVNYQMHSEPLDPESISMRYHEDPEVYTRKSSPWKILVALLVGVVFGAFVASFVLFLRSKVVKRYPITPLEYPELDEEIGSKKIVFDELKVVGSDAKEKA